MGQFDDKVVVITDATSGIGEVSIADMHSYVIGRSYAYSASKLAVIPFARQMAKNYAPDDIRVNCICPGIIDTPILGDRDRKVYAEKIPLGYLGKPEDVANVLVFLASKKASYLTGVVLRLTGGIYLICIMRKKVMNVQRKL